MPGLTWVRQFSPEAGPYDGITWIKRDCRIEYQDGTIKFHQLGVESPDFWTDLPTRITAQKYFRGFVDKQTGIPGVDRETSIKDVVERICNEVRRWLGYYQPPDMHSMPPEGWRCVKVLKNKKTGVLHTAGEAERFVPELTDRTPDTPVIEDPNYEFIGTACHKRPEGAVAPEHEVYFDSRESLEAYIDDLKWLYIHQYLCFNSPVQFNVGQDKWPQVHACFILKVNDWVGNEDRYTEFDIDQHGLLAWQVKEGLIFVSGSGAGANMSSIRSRREFLSSGGFPTGPIHEEGGFAQGPDAWAALIKSGGTTRRAAKMLELDMDHPDIQDFIHIKANEEEVAKDLIHKAQYDDDMDGRAYRHAFHQNSNLSVSAPDEFMQAVEGRDDWPLISRTQHHLGDLPTRTNMDGSTGKVLSTINAYQLMQEISQQCWQSGDPGMQFRTTINNWHTCKNDEQIRGSNPCSEYFFIDETACNLGSLNLARFWDAATQAFDFVKYAVANRVATITMDCFVSCARYPTRHMQKMSNLYRTIGVGFTNLGGLLMRMRVEYGSERAQSIAGLISSFMTATVYEQSCGLAQTLGAFERYKANQKSVHDVMVMHRGAHMKLDRGAFAGKWQGMYEAAKHSWTNICKCTNPDGTGLRNAQATAIAPTGTIGLFMDCDTFSIEPSFALRQFKMLAGGGTLEIVNPIAEDILREELSEEKFNEAMTALMPPKDEEGRPQPSRSIRPFISEKLASVLRTTQAYPDDPDYHIVWEDHINMMAAVQPFISGGISKTINLPHSATVEDHFKAYMLAWHLGLKSVAIYRDGSKETQAISTSAQADGSKKPPKELADVTMKLVQTAVSTGRGARKPVPQTVPAVTIKVKVDANYKAYLTVGFYPDTWEICQLFCEMNKSGSAIGGAYDWSCMLFSFCLQHGVPIETLVKKSTNLSFEPSGFVQNDPHIKTCRSIPDYIARKLDAIQKIAMEKGPEVIMILAAQSQEIVIGDGSFGADQLEGTQSEKDARHGLQVGNACPDCGSFDVQFNGKCLICHSCGKDDGGCFQ